MAGTAESGVSVSLGRENPETALAVAEACLERGASTCIVIEPEAGVRGGVEPGGLVGSGGPVGSGGLVGFGELTVTRLRRDEERMVVVARRVGPLARCREVFVGEPPAAVFVWRDAALAESLAPALRPARVVTVGPADLVVPDEPVLVPPAAERLAAERLRPDRAAERHAAEWLGGDRPGRLRRVVFAAAAAVVIVVGVVGIAVRWAVADGGEDASPQPVDRELAIVGVTTRVPVDWRVSVVETPAGGAVPGVVDRAVADHPVDGRRLVLAVQRISAESTLADVAAGLRRSIAATSTARDLVAPVSYGGRDVIAYREVPPTGRPLRWFVIVDDGRQVSVGCRAGDGGEDVDVICAASVASLVFR